MGQKVSLWSYLELDLKMNSLKVLSYSFWDVWPMLFKSCDDGLLYSIVLLRSSQRKLYEFDTLPE